MNFSTALLLLPSVSAQTSRLRTSTSYRSHRKLQGTMNIFDAIPAVAEPAPGPGVIIFTGPELIAAEDVPMDNFDVSMSLPPMMPDVTLSDPPEKPEMTTPTKPMGPSPQDEPGMTDIELSMSVPDNAMGTTTVPPSTTVFVDVTDTMSMPESIFPTATAATSEFGTILPTSPSMSTTSPMITSVGSATSFGGSSTDATSVGMTTEFSQEDTILVEEMSMILYEDEPMSFEWDGDESMSLPSFIVPEER